MMSVHVSAAKPAMVVTVASSSGQPTIPSAATVARRRSGYSWLLSIKWLT